MSFICRVDELKILEEQYSKNSSSFVAVYGRRRVGKTELIDHFIESKNCFSFRVTGAYDATLKSHLDNFANKLSLAFGCFEYSFANWNEAFAALQDNITSTKLMNNCKFTIFIDELPWLAQMKNNGFKSALSLFWNDFASKRDDIFLVVCGSATSWIINHIIEDSGSLANRITGIIHLNAFNLKETKIFLQELGHKGLSNKTVVDYFMVLGGVAHYLKLLNPKISFVQNIEQLFFTQNGVLRTEYNHLFRSLFKNHKTHEIIVKYLSSSWSGFSLVQLGGKKDLQVGAALSGALKELEESGFLVKRFKYGQQKRDVLYSLCDPFIYFFTKWVKGTSTMDLLQNKFYFQKVFKGQSYKVWSGFAFENICHSHILQIKYALSIGGVITSNHYWSKTTKQRDKNGTQIDILLKRDDDVINIIECKYYNKEFVIDKKYANELQNKELVFQESSSYKGSINIIFITINGIKQNEYYDEIVTNDITIDDLL
ncbi:MAG: ATP-binding protein [Campylobacterota bacterium]|nr:ATP-binding protein [Campylobacterota bacterium]